MPSGKPRVGLIVPSSNTVMEPDLHRHLSGTCTISTSRIYLEDVTRRAEKQMLEDELPRSIGLIKTTKPDIVIFGCTSAGSLGGREHDRRISESIARGTGCAALTVVESVLAQLQSLSAHRVAIFTPYEEDLTRSVASCISSDGYELAQVAGMGIRANIDIGKVIPTEIVKFIDSKMDGVKADCIFLSCTNWQALDAIESTQTRFGIPVVTSNQATLDAVLRIIG